MKYFQYFILVFFVVNNNKYIKALGKTVPPLSKHLCTTDIVQISKVCLIACLLASIILLNKQKIYFCF